MEELVGNAEGFAASGYVNRLNIIWVFMLVDRVSSEVVLKYLAQILGAALDLNPQIQAPAIEILTFTVKQGLAHPLQVWLRIQWRGLSSLSPFQSFPVIVALETHPNITISSRAILLHAFFHTKYTNLLNARYFESAKASYEYQEKLNADVITGIFLRSSSIFAISLVSRLSIATQYDQLRLFVTKMVFPSSR